MPPASRSTFGLLPFQQGGLDSLCGLYSIVNAERIINRSSDEETQQLFNDLVHFLSRRGLLSKFLIGGIHHPQMLMILDKVVGKQRISNVWMAADAGLPEIIDATNLRRQHREPFIGAARSAGCPVAILACNAIPATIAERVQRRLISGLDPSEAGPAIVEHQRLELEPPQPDEADVIVTCSTDGPIDISKLAEGLRSLRKN